MRTHPRAGKELSSNSCLLRGAYVGLYVDRSRLFESNFGHGLVLDEAAWGDVPDWRGGGRRYRGAERCPKRVERRCVRAERLEAECGKEEHCVSLPA